jgi:hypothetical protein
MQAIRSKPLCAFATLIAAGMLSGCTGYLPGLPVDYDVASDTNKGVITGSVGTNPLGKQWREWGRYDFHSITDSKIRGHVTSAVNWSNPFYPQPECPDDGLMDECASLFAIILPAGQYEFSTVIPAMDSHAAGYGAGYATVLKNYKFEVRAGAVTYIVNMLSRLCGGSSYSYYGMARIGRARVAQGDVADMYERDLPLLKEKFPQLQNITVNNETMAGTPWRWEYKQSDETLLATNWQNDCAPFRMGSSESPNATEN